MGVGNIKTNYPCDQHPDRIEAVVRGECHYCWECYLGPDDFAKRFPADFYDPQYRRPVTAGGTF